MANPKTQVEVSIISKLGQGFTGAFKTASTKLDEFRKTVDKTSKAVGDIKDYKRQQEAVKQAGYQWQAAKVKADAFRQSITASGAPTRQQTRDLRAMEAATGRAGEQFARQRERLAAMNRELRNAGVNTGKLSSEYGRLKSRLEAVQAQHDRAERSLRTQRAIVEGMAGTWRGIASAAAGVAAGRHAASVVAKPVTEGLGISKKYEIEQARIRGLGMGSENAEKTISLAQNSKFRGTSRAENMELAADALSIFSDYHHAEMALPYLQKMKYANSVLYGDSAANSDKAFFDMLKVIELRGGANSEERFKTNVDMMQRVMSATRGRVGGEEYRNLLSTGGNALQAMRDDAFYYQLEPLVQMMGGHQVGTGLATMYGNLYQGKTTKRVAQNIESLGLIADPSKVKHDKAGQLSFFNPGALKGSELFRASPYEWVHEVLLPALQKKKGFDPKKFNSEDEMAEAIGEYMGGEVFDAVGGISSNRNTAKIIAQMIKQRGVIEKSYKANAAAMDTDEALAAAMGTTSGRERLAAVQKENAELRLGEEVLPTYTKAVEGATSMLEKFSNAMANSPMLAKTAAYGIAGGAAAAGVGTTVAATLVGKALFDRLMGKAPAAAAAGGGAAAASGATAGAAGGVLSTAARLAGPAAGVVTLANLTSDREDAIIAGAINSERAKMSSLTSQYGRDTLEKAFAAKAPWYQFGGVDSAKPERLEGWVKEYLAGQASDAAKAASDAAKAASEAATTAQNRPNVTITNTYTVPVTVPQGYDPAQAQEFVTRAMQEHQRRVDSSRRSSMTDQLGY